MSNINDAKQLILETEIDNVIEESFLGSLSKVKFEVAGVLAGAAAILFKLPEQLAKKAAVSDWGISPADATMTPAQVDITVKKLEAAQEIVESKLSTAYDFLQQDFKKMEGVTDSSDEFRELATNIDIGLFNSDEKLNISIITNSLDNIIKKYPEKHDILLNLKEKIVKGVVSVDDLRHKLYDAIDRLDSISGDQFSTSDIKRFNQDVLDSTGDLTFLIVWFSVLLIAIAILKLITAKSHSKKDITDFALRLKKHLIGTVRNIRSALK